MSVGNFGNVQRFANQRATVTNSNIGNVGNVETGQVRNGNGQTGRRLIRCYNCHGLGHMANACPQPRVYDSNYYKKQ